MREVKPHKPLTRPSTRSLLASLYAVDPSDCLISQVNESSYSTLFHLIPVELAVLRAAAELEPNPALVITWYRETPIAALGQLTAEQLVGMGRAELVVAFLRRIHSSAYDEPAPANDQLFFTTVS
jgi:hypothetical protein